jgi:hypothetical protein
MAMRAANAKMDFEAFGVRDIRDIEIEASRVLRQGLSPVLTPNDPKGATHLTASDAAGIVSGR